MIDSILTSGRVEQQSYRSCMGLLKLAEKYSDQMLERACARALQYSNAPSYKSVKNILLAGKDLADVPSLAAEKSNSSKYGITRGARHYGGKSND